MKERHAIPDAVKLETPKDGAAIVNITDGEMFIHISLENATWGAGLTPQQARWIARQLIQSAARVEAGTTQ